MTKVLVLYYSMYGHIEKMAYAVADGVREVEGVDVVVKRVPELVPEEIAKQNHFKLDQPAPVASTAGRKPRCSPPSRSSCTRAWSMSVCPIPARSRWAWRR